MRTSVLVLYRYMQLIQYVLLYYLTMGFTHKCNSDTLCAKP